MRVGISCYLMQTRCKKMRKRFIYVLGISIVLVCGAIVVLYLKDEAVDVTIQLPKELSAENITNITASEIASDNTSLQLCPRPPPKLLGYYEVDLERKPASLQESIKRNPTVKDGGRFAPSDCRARTKVAIIIPFRNRDRHLLYFLQYHHPILQRQQVEYKIYVVNQFGMGTFNKDKLMNVGYVEAAKDGFDCFVFHDVDVILTNDRCLYVCQRKPVHLAHSIDKFDGLMYPKYFGGAVMMSKEQFEKINGMSNNFWGWGGEDDDIYYRIEAAGMSFIRYPMEIARYKMVKHDRDHGNPVNENRWWLLGNVNFRYKVDGLNTLDHKIVTKEDKVLYTNITVDVLEPITPPKTTCLGLGHFFIGIWLGSFGTGLFLFVWFVYL